MATDKVNLHDLKIKPPEELLAYAEKVGVENASALKKQNMLFAILKSLADKNIIIDEKRVRIPINIAASIKNTSSNILIK